MGRGGPTETEAMSVVKKMRAENFMAVGWEGCLSGKDWRWISIAQRCV